MSGKQGNISIAAGSPLTLTNGVLSADVHSKASVYTKAEADIVFATKAPDFSVSAGVLTYSGNVTSTNLSAYVTHSSLSTTPGRDSTKSQTESPISTAVAADVLLAGGGLTKTGSTLSVKGSQPQITSVGRLTNSGTGPVRLYDGLMLGRDQNCSST